MVKVQSALSYGWTLTLSTPDVLAADVSIKEILAGNTTKSWLSPITKSELPFLVSGSNISVKPTRILRSACLAR
ncbi:DUF1010 domain-containing protein [Simplicispira metamorpha]